MQRIVLALLVFEVGFGVRCGPTDECPDTDPNCDSPTRAEALEDGPIADAVRQAAFDPEALPACDDAWIDDETVLPAASFEREAEWLVVYADPETSELCEAPER